MSFIALLQIYCVLSCADSKYKIRVSPCSKNKHNTFDIWYGSLPIILSSYFKQRFFFTFHLITTGKVRIGLHIYDCLFILYYSILLNHITEFAILALSFIIGNNAFNFSFVRRNRSSLNIYILPIQLSFV